MSFAESAKATPASLCALAAALCATKLRATIMINHVPDFGAQRFSCPHCKTVSQQEWFSAGRATTRILEALDILYHDYRTRIQDYQQTAVAAFLQHMRSEFGNSFASLVPKKMSVSICATCNEPTLWIEKDVVYPEPATIEDPNADLNESIRILYLEAASIVNRSPRGATALLRLALQLLMVQLGKDGKNINSDIKELVAAGLSPKIQKALDLLRVVGNHAVHPGQISLDDNKEIALKMFQILNLVAHEMLTKPREIDDLYENLIPESAKEHIKSRDGG